MKSKDAAGITMLLALIALSLSKCDSERAGTAQSGKSQRTEEDPKVRKELADLREIIRVRKELEDEQKRKAEVSALKDAAWPVNSEKPDEKK